MTVEDLETRLVDTVATNKLKNKVTENEIEKYFANNRLHFDSAKISSIVLENEGMASEVLSQIQDEDEDFQTLARQHSIDTTSKDSGGHLGHVNRKSMSPQVESVVFAAEAGDVVGPVKTDMGHHIIKVEEINNGELNDKTRAVIKDSLFTNWLAEEGKNAKIDLKLMEMI